MAWEISFIVALQSLGNTFFDVVFDIISMFGEELILVTILGFVYWTYDKKFGEFLGFSILTSLTLNAYVKNIVARPRPFEASDLIDNKKPATAGGYSFPSGHSQGSGTVFPSLAIYKKKKWLIVIAFVIPLLVVFSRLYLGAHYPTDVLAGLALGVGVSYLCYYLFNKIENKLWLYLGVMAIFATGFFFAKTDDYFKNMGMLVGCLSGVLFEKKFVKFELNFVWWKMIIRVALGLGIFMGLRLGLKAIFPISVWFDGLRYLIMTFCGIALYPWLFKVLHI